MTVAVLKFALSMEADAFDGILPQRYPAMWRMGDG